VGSRDVNIRLEREPPTTVLAALFRSTGRRRPFRTEREERSMEFDQCQIGPEA